MTDKKLVFTLSIAVVLGIIFFILIQKMRIESAPKTYLSETAEDAGQPLAAGADLDNIIPVNAIPSPQEIANNIKDAENRDEDIELIKTEIKKEKIRGDAMMQSSETNTTKENNETKNISQS